MIIDHEYHGVELDQSIPGEVMEWLRMKFGDSGTRWFAKGGWGSATIYFKEERDHLLFLMTWGK